MEKKTRDRLQVEGLRMSWVRALSLTAASIMVAAMAVAQPRPLPDLPVVPESEVSEAPGPGGLTPEERRMQSRAAVQMALVVLTGLVVVVLMLRWVGRRNASERGGPDPTAQIVDRIQEALEQADRERES